MDLDNREKLIELYDIYKNLLTKKQQDYFEDYYYNDLSFYEIASNYDVSRNAVFDQLKRTCNTLTKYEEALHIYEKNNKIILEIEKINDLDLKNKILNIMEE
jgi:predicted DNA-binding protein YlxM (UPF0122 family)